VTTEIRKRAGRLKSNLRLPDPEPLAKAQPYSNANDDGQLRKMLLALDNLIMSFVKNPLFQSPDVVNVKHAAKAHRDLLDIIELSRSIGKDAEQMGKTAKSP
jgi:hypothetical protein